MRWLVGVAVLCAAPIGWADGVVKDPVVGKDLQHFKQIDTHIFAGSKPKTDADFEFLRSKGVKYVLQAHFLPLGTGSERARAKKFGMEFVAIPMNASFIAPQAKHVNEILRIMRTQQPIYVHCVLGRDRTSLLAGLYRIYFDGISKEKAYTLMKEEGFRDVFFLHGLKTYFEKHTQVPPDLAHLAHPN